MKRLFLSAAIAALFLLLPAGAAAQQLPTPDSGGNGTGISFAEDFVAGFLGDLENAEIDPPFGYLTWEEYHRLNGGDTLLLLIGNYAANLLLGLWPVGLPRPTGGG